MNLVTCFQTRNFGFCVWEIVGVSGARSQSATGNKNLLSDEFKGPSLSVSAKALQEGLAAWAPMVPLGSFFNAKPN